ncbi:MAG: hypothetical protein H7099_18655 [Gemmatimonadaceae bacterium]|nr:hypothetical protein [Gemmatimonadaceae bacterium]
MIRTATLVIAGTLALAAPAGAQSTSDSTYRRVQTRGRAVMGVDQYTSRHQFDLLPDGARISLRAANDDSAGVVAIRKHFRDIARQFARGNFAAPGLVHGRTVPGTTTMTAKRRVIAFRTHELPRGAELWITTDDSSAITAIREFIAFQRSDHRAGGTDSSTHRMHHPARP